MIRNCLFTTIALLLFASCKEVTEKVGTRLVPENSRIVHITLIDTLGTVILSVPIRYDTFFSWIDHSDCGKPCDIQKYRYQPKGLRITKESGFLWLGEPKDSVDRFTLSHLEEFPFHNGDTAKDFVRHEHLKSELMSNPGNPPIIFDTIEKINDRYYSIFAMQRSDSILCKRVLAVTTIKGNLVRFQYDLLRTKADSIESNFIKKAIELIRTIRIDNGI
jgi:hypothetical protein